MPGVIQKVVVCLLPRLEDFLKVTAQGNQLPVRIAFLVFICLKDSFQEMDLTLACIIALYFEAVLFYFFWQYGGSKAMAQQASWN